MDFIIDLIRDVISKFDWQYMIAVNVLTWIIIKIVDEANGVKTIPTWMKRSISVLSGIGLGVATIYVSDCDKSIIVYSFVLSLISWDCIFKPIINYVKTKFNINIDYRKKDNNDYTKV